MAKVFTAILFCLLFIACWQADDNRKPFPDQIQNRKLAKHKNIPGTRVFFVPPAGFKISSKFKGLEKGAYTRIEVIDLDEGNFYKNTATFTRVDFERAGYPVLEFKELTLNGFHGKMALLRGQNSVRAYSLVFGDSTFSTSISAIFNGRDRGIGEQVRRALVSLYYDTSIKLSPPGKLTVFAPPVFTLDDSKSIFKYAKSETGKIIYSLQGKVKNGNDTAPYVVAFNVPLAGRTLEQVADRQVLIPGNYNTGSTNEGTTNGFPSITREVFGELEGKEVFIFQHFVLIGDTVVCMQGVVGSDDFEKYLEEFKKLTNTVSKK